MQTLSNPTFFLTKAAAQHICKILQNEPAGFFFRLAVSGGGCNGMQYNFTLDNTSNPDDFTFSSENACIVIDQISLSFVEGSTLEYKQELIGSNFQVLNPKASASCGCNNSFTVSL